MMYSFTQQINLKQTLAALSVIASLLSCPIAAHDECQKLPPFEKIYVTPYQILSTPYGTYYINPQGTQIPVSSISTDCTGTYVILTNRQCTKCGRIFQGPISSSAGTNCTFGE